MTTERHKGVPGSDLPPLRGAHLHLHVDETDTRDITILRNATLRGEFQYPDGRGVELKAGPRVALYALLTYRHQDDDWILQMDQFADTFVETKTTVYTWIRVLEETGFVVRWRVNDPATGKFEWHIAASARPGVLPGAVGNPQVTPSVQKGGDGAAPPVDNLDNRRSHHPYKKPSMEKPTMVKPAHGDPYRETLKEELPASPPSTSHARTTEEAAEEGSPREQQQRSLSLVRPTVPVDGEADLAAEPDWVAWVTELLDRRAVLDASPLRPSRQDIDLIAIRGQVAADQGWTREQLAGRVLLVHLAGVEHLGAVWLARLHPAKLGPPPASGRKTQVEQGLVVADPMQPRPSADRIAEIRQAAGAPGRGPRWTQLGGKP